MVRQTFFLGLYLFDKILKIQFVKMSYLFEQIRHQKRQKYWRKKYVCLIYTYSLYFLFVNYYYSKIFRTIMQTVSSNFQKYINEIQLLRKQINGQKISHQNTIKQLQSSYQIIDDLKDVLRTQQTSNLKLKNEISSLSQKLMTISHQYEDQIHEIKDMIALKDQELRRLNSYMMVNDADVIRLKVINQVQIGHKEELERYGLEIMKKGVEINQIRANMNFAINKNQVLERQIRSLKEENSDKIDQMNAKFTMEMKGVYDLLQKQRNENKKISKKYEFLQNKFNKQSQFYKEQMSKLNKQLHNENKSLLSNTQAKTNKHKIQKLQETVIKQKQQLSNDRSLITKLQDQISRLKKQLKNQKKNQIDINNQKDRLHQELQILKTDMINRDNHYKKQIESVKKQAEGKNQYQEKGKFEEKDKVSRLENENKRLAFKVEQLNAEIIGMREELADQNVAILRKNIKAKDSQIEALQDEIRQLKKMNNDRKRTVSIYDKKEIDVSLYKAKLHEANEKIVELLREKIELKQQIKQYQSRE